MEGRAPSDGDAQGEQGSELEHACADLESLERLLAEAVADARTPTTDVRALANWAERRIAVQEQAAALERRVVAALSRAGLSGESSLVEFEQGAPQAAAAVRARVNDVRARLGELREAERRRAELVARCKEIVGRYLGVIDPPVRAYGRGGARPAQPEGSTATVRSSVRRSA